MAKGFCNTIIAGSTTFCIFFCKVFYTGVGNRPYHIRCIIGAAIIYYNYLKIFIGLLKQAFNGVLNDISPVICRHDDRKQY